MAGAKDVTPMKTPDAVTGCAWLASPIVTPLGELRLAGFLDDASHIDPGAKRMLDDYTLVFVVRGEGFFCDARGFSHPLASGDAVLLFPRIAHAYGALEHDGKPVRWTQIYFVFNGPQFDLLRAHGIISPDRPVLRLGAVDFWRRRLDEVLSSDTTHGAGGSLRAVGKFAHVLIEMAAAARDATQPAHAEWLDKALRLLGNRTAAGWMPPREVARAVGMNYDNFRKQFSAHTGESPGSRRKRRRIECACAALYHNRAGLKEIAADLGFCDEFHFSKTFKQMTGATPSDYRKKMRGA